MKNGVNDSFFSYMQIGLKRVFVTSYNVVMVTFCSQNSDQRFTHKNHYCRVEKKSIVILIYHKPLQSYLKTTKPL